MGFSRRQFRDGGSKIRDRNRSQGGDCPSNLKVGQEDFGAKGEIPKLPFQGGFGHVVVPTRFSDNLAIIRSHGGPPSFIDSGQAGCHHVGRPPPDFDSDARFKAALDCTGMVKAASSCQPST